jgi:hypothetical protein
MQRSSCEKCKKSRGEEGLSRNNREIIEVETSRLFLDVFSVVCRFGISNHASASPHCTPSPQLMPFVLGSLNPRGDLTALSMCHINAAFPVYLPNVVFARQVPGSAREDPLNSFRGISASKSVCQCLAILATGSL